MAEAVLQLNFNLANNYDLATMLIAQMRTVAQEIRDGNAGIDLRQVDEFQQQLRLLEQRLGLKQDLLEQFEVAQCCPEELIALFALVR